jgi:hypothetical protein
MGDIWNSENMRDIRRAMIAGQACLAVNSLSIVRFHGTTCGLK